MAACISSIVLSKVPFFASGVSFSRIASIAEAAVRGLTGYEECGKGRKEWNELSVAGSWVNMACLWYS
jgi:hypothetical protein